MDEELIKKKVNLEDLINYLIFCKSEIKEISLQDLMDTWDSIDGFEDLTESGKKDFQSEVLESLRIIKNSLEQIIQDRL